MENKYNKKYEVTCPDCGKTRKLTYNSFRQSVNKCQTCGKRSLPKGDSDDLCNNYQGKNVVYFLPYEYYVGITNGLPGRLSQHRNKGNKNIGDWKVLAVTETLEEAAVIEAQYHTQGYNGFNWSPGKEKVKRTIQNYL